MHWCLGMQSSGSTWTYYVTLQIAASVEPTKPTHGYFMTYLADLEFLQPGHTNIVKTHAVFEDMATALSGLADSIVITIRDPRDAVTSIMLYQDSDFDWSLCMVELSARLCTRFVDDKRSLLFRYENGFIDDVTTLDLIAGTFHKPLAVTDRTRIFACSRRAAIEGFIAELPRRLTTRINSRRRMFDPVTQWHTHHAGRTGEIGRWRHSLTKGQVSEVERRLGGWMDYFSYQRFNTAAP
jgi:hypothetical protein